MAAVRFALMALLLCLGALLPGRAAAQPDEQQKHVKVTLVAETLTPAAGGTVTIGFASVPDAGWHAYWKNPGDAGLPPAMAWTLPSGVTAGEPDFPVPQTLIIGGLMNYVYEGPFTPLVKLTIPAGLARGTKLPVGVRYDFLVCTDKICVPDHAILSAELTVGDGAVEPGQRARFDGWRTALPRPLGAEGSYQLDAGRFRIAIPFPAGAAADGAVYFFPATDGLVDYAAPQTVAREGDRFVIETRAKPDAKAGEAIEGLLAFGKDRGFALRAVPGQVPAVPGTAGAAPGGQPLWIAALLAFGGAVLGGLLLNIMPCVFPILSLKALSLAKANDGGGRPRAEALAYTAGVVLVCLALGGMLLALRAGGATLGWAFQLQDPRVILLLLLLVTGIALNLAGLFEVMTPRFIGAAAGAGSGDGTGGAFLTGALAAFIATPCTGPFMGVALGTALVLSWPAALAVFGGLGLGLALPFLAIGFVPALRRRLPRPGPWMEAFRRILSIPMFLTAIALLWVYGRQTGVDGMSFALLVTLGLALVLWGGGRKQARGGAFGPFGLAMIALVAAGGVWLASRTPAPSGAADRKVAAGAEPFTEARLAALRAGGRPVFAYFTADWCLTCKVNEKAVIETQATADALAAGKVAVLVGDWTDGDPVLGRFIEAHNRAGVPLYLWYKPGAAEPEVLPQILTQEMMRRYASGG
ncbi:protein-disulfide reductase DsbD family protein [Sphingomonas canadensis]|uniref:Protein-disulfide reductase DsbD family protein n=1 Tax=Sphingomonas canadensis TaxID=1219257 RepID=A0ABW3H5T0_9SPHN|nr:thioredoxin family protein [Sphingomonas canadensis]MCW3836363.1 protein-disulfide reductase DsbD family protein [Sphingomonas canadensis]